MNDKELTKIISEFVSGLLKKIKCNHAGNCLVMCEILQPYLFWIFGIATTINNCKVKQGRKKINHYYLLRIRDGIIIDPTASQFKTPEGNQMPKVYVGVEPLFYEKKQRKSLFA